MCTISLLEVNRAAEEQLRLQRIAKIHADVAKAAQEDLTLKQRYQRAAETMKRQLHALRLNLMSAPRMMSMPFETDTLTVSPPSPYSPRSRQMSITAPVFTPNLVSESNSDIDSSSQTSNTSDSEEGFNMDILVVGSDSEDSQVSGQSEQLATRRELLGKTISGRLNVYTPKNGTIRYYINWSKNTHDNILVTPEAMEATFGSLEELQTGMYLQATIFEVPADPKEHPSGTNMSVVPAPKTAKRRRKRRQKRSRAPTASNE